VPVTAMGVLPPNPRRGGRSASPIGFPPAQGSWVASLLQVSTLGNVMKRALLWGEMWMIVADRMPQHFDRVSGSPTD